MAGSHTAPEADEMAHSHGEDGNKHVHHRHAEPHQDQTPWSEHSHPVEPLALPSASSPAIIPVPSFQGLSVEAAALPFLEGPHTFVPQAPVKNIFHPPS